MGSRSCVSSVSRLVISHQVGRVAARATTPRRDEAATDERSADLDISDAILTGFVALSGKSLKGRGMKE